VSEDEPLSGLRLDRMTWPEVEERLGNALAGPTIRVGCSEHHMDFPGTISLRAETLVEVCRDCCTSLARHGFRSVTESGILGDARGFDPAIGERCVAELADLMAAAFRGD